MKQWIVLQIVQTSPSAPFPKTNQQAPQRAGHPRRAEGECAEEKYCVSFKKKKKKLSQTPEQSNYNWHDKFVFKHAFKKKKKRERAISQHVMLQPDKFVISNISKHLAQKKTPHFVPGI